MNVKVYKGDWVERTYSGSTRKWRASLAYTYDLTETYLTVRTELWLDLSGSSSTTIGISSSNKCTGTIYVSGSSVQSESKPSSGSKTINAEDGWKITQYVKSYPRTHSQQTKALSGVVKIADGSVWHGSSKAVCTDKIVIPAKRSFKVSYNANGGSGAPGQQTKWYGETLTLSTTKPTRTGYTFAGWYTAPSGGSPYGTTYSGNATVTLYAHWTANKYTATFDANNGEGQVPSPSSATYNAQFTFPSKGNLTRDNYEFIGWSLNPVFTADDYSVYKEGNSIIWTFTSPLTFYAVWKPITVYINYLSYNRLDEVDFDKTTSYNPYARSEHIQNSSYVIDNTAVSDLNNYTFSGYWKLDSPYEKEFTEKGITFPKGIIPYDYNISTDSINKIYTVGDEIEVKTGDLNLYPIYRDNTRSTITSVSSSYEYIKDSVKETDYFLYLSDQVNSINSDLFSQNVVIGIILRSTNPNIEINTASAVASLQEKLDPSEKVSLNPIFFRTLTDEDSSTLYYIICRTTGKSGGILHNYEVTDYRFIVSGLKDSFGKTLDDIIVDIIPPTIVQDINKKGNIVAFFTKAPDTLEEEFLLIGGHIAIGLPLYQEQSTNLDTELYDMINSLGLGSDIIEV